jgi:putative acetyltransferase
MYFLPETRGFGIGTEMMEVCIQSAQFWFRKMLFGNVPFYA